MPSVSVPMRDVVCREVVIRSVVGNGGSRDSSNRIRVKYFMADLFLSLDGVMCVMPKVEFTINDDHSPEVMNVYKMKEDLEYLAEKLSFNCHLGQALMDVCRGAADELNRDGMYCC